MNDPLTKILSLQNILPSVSAEIPILQNDLFNTREKGPMFQNSFDNFIMEIIVKMDDIS